MSNTLFKVVALGAVLLHCAALVASVMPRRTVTPMLVANILVATLALLGLVADGSPLLSPVDWQMLGAWLFEAAALGLAVIGLRGSAVARRLSIVAFLINLVASAGAAVFALTFAMPRMI